MIETPEANLSAAIQWLNVSYATYFNKKHQRSGHLFQGRFKAFLVDVDEYLKQLSRYVHLNPVRAKIVTGPSDYTWSSYPAFMGKVKSPDWLNTRWLLSIFGKRKRQAIKNYRSFVEDTDIKDLEDPFEKVIEGIFLGGPDFIEWAKTSFLSNQAENKELPQLKALKSKTPVETILHVVSNEFSCSQEHLVEKGRKRNRARDVAIYLSRNYSGITCNDLGQVFGGISGAAITMKYKQMSEEIPRDKRLKVKVKKVREQILNI